MATGTVGSIVGADTFDLLQGTLVRLANVDAPEASTTAGWRARRKLQELLPGGTRIRYGQKDRCHGRVVAEVWRSSDGLHVNAAMRRFLGRQEEGARLPP